MAEEPREERLSVEEFQDLYGPWCPWRPVEVLERFRSAPFRWWVAGGWAAEAGGASPRPHEDIDVAVLARDLPAVREWLADHHLWEAHQGGLRPLRPGTSPSPGCEQFWVRRNAMSPWVVDILLTRADGETWLFKRDERVRLPLAEVGWVAPDGVSYLRPRWCSCSRPGSGGRRTRRTSTRSCPGSTTPPGGGCRRHSPSPIRGTPGERWWRDVRSERRDEFRRPGSSRW
ncbi:MAG: nucleotidyltransferase domain-containing protein [Acidimicrobiales bacterium]